MLACFTRGSGYDGRGPGKRRKTGAPQERGEDGCLAADPTPEEEEQVFTQLATLREGLPIRHRERVEEILLGAGANGMAFVEGPRISVAFEGDVAVYFQGAPRRALSRNAESPAHDVLHKYARGLLVPSPSGGGLCPGHLTGDFAVVIFDKRAGRILAARDHQGVEPLYWGSSHCGEMLLLSSDRRVLEATCPDVDAFPSGTLFRSKRGEVTGELTALAVYDWTGEKGLQGTDAEPPVLDEGEASAAAAGAAAAEEDEEEEEEQKNAPVRVAGERRRRVLAGGGTRGLSLSHCKRSFQNLNRADSERSLHSLHGSQNSLRDAVGSQGEIHVGV